MKNARIRSFGVSAHFIRASRPSNFEALFYGLRRPYEPFTSLLLAFLRLTGKSQDEARGIEPVAALGLNFAVEAVDELRDG